MSKTIEVQFTKYHGLGNDFVVARASGLPRPLPALARSITNRHTGIGADGFIVTMPPRDKNNDARIRFFNADGSEPEMSGNGIRCAAAFLLSEKQDRGTAVPAVGSHGQDARATLKIETRAGTKSLEVVKAENGKWVFKVGMGAPILAPAKIPFRAANVTAPVVGFPLQIQGSALPVTVTSMGNPHCTVFVANFLNIDWARIGREIENDPHFPNRTNVEFVKVRSRHEIEVRFWERGVGETMSSGTGSSAAVVASILNGLTERRVRVRTPAGNLQVEWPARGEVILTGPADRIAQGTYYFQRG